MANRPTQRSMQDLLEKQVNSLQEIHNTLTTSKLIELGQLVEEKKALDDDNILVEEIKDIHLIANAILESLIEIKDKFLAMPTNTNEDKAETAKSNERMLNALEGIENNTKAKPSLKEDIKEGFSLGGIISGIGIALGALAGVISAYVKNIKFWLKLFTPELMKKEISEVVKIIRTVFSNLGLKLKEIFDTKLKSLGDFFENSINKIKSIFKIDDESKISKVFKWLKTGIKNFFAPFEEAYIVLKDLIAGPAKESKGIFTVIGENLGKFGKMFGAVAKIVGTLLYPLTIVMTLWDTVKGAIEGYEKEGVVGAIQGALTGFFNSLVGGLADLVKDMASWVLEKLGFEEASKDLDSFSFQDIIADFFDALFHPIDTIKRMISSIQISIVETLNSLIDKWNDSVPDALKIDKIEVPKAYESDHVRPSQERKQKEGTKVGETTKVESVKTESVKGANNVKEEPTSTKTGATYIPYKEPTKVESVKGTNNVKEEPTKVESVKGTNNVKEEPTSTKTGATYIPYKEPTKVESVKVEEPKIVTPTKTKLEGSGSDYILAEQSIATANLNKETASDNGWMNPQVETTPRPSIQEQLNNLDVEQSKFVKPEQIKPKKPVDLGDNGWMNPQVETTPRPSIQEQLNNLDAQQVYQKSAENVDKKEDMATKGGGNTVVSAPTVNTSNKTVNQQSIKSPTRNPDITVRSYNNIVMG